jgi:two-component system, NarL family, sensor kinase
MSPESVSAAGERRVAWLRVAAIGLIVAAERLPHPNPNRDVFEIAALCAVAYSLVALAVVYRRTVPRTLSLAMTATDVLVITMLAFLSGGPYSDARLAYFFVPISVAFRFGWRTTLLATVFVVLAYDVQAVTHPARHLNDAARFVAVQTGYLLWIGIAATLFSGLLAARTQRLAELARGRRRLLADVMTAEDRSRRILAETLHDNAIQNVLASRQDVEDAAKTGSREDLDRAYRHLSETAVALRSAIFELHPHVLEQAGLEKALRAVAEQASRRAGFAVDLHLDYPARHPDEALLLRAAREFIDNAAKHAHASLVTITLASEDEVVLTIADDGSGFDPRMLDRVVADAHIGLLSQRERIEAAGGTLTIASTVGRGATVTVRLPWTEASPAA